MRDFHVFSHNSTSTNSTCRWLIVNRSALSTSIDTSLWNLTMASSSNQCSSFSESAEEQREGRLQRRQERETAKQREERLVRRQVMDKARRANHTSETGQHREEIVASSNDQHGSFSEEQREKTSKEAGERWSPLYFWNSGTKRGEIGETASHGQGQTSSSNRRVYHLVRRQRKITQNHKVRSGSPHIMPCYGRNVWAMYPSPRVHARQLWPSFSDISRGVAQHVQAPS